MAGAVKATVVGAAYGEELEGDGVDGGGALKRGILGAVLGGLFGGAKGALVGIGVGAGSTVFAGKGEDVDLPPGTQLRVRFDTSVSVTWGPVQGPRRQRRRPCQPPSGRPQPPRAVESSSTTVGSR